MEPSKPDRQKVWDQDHRDPSLKGFLNWIPQPKRQWHKETGFLLSQEDRPETAASVRFSKM